MIAAEQAVRDRALQWLSDDAVLTGLVHQIFDGLPPRATPPYVVVAAAEGSDWGTKDRAGREVRLTLVLVGAGASIDAIAAARIDAAAAGLRGTADGWTMAGARIMRTRLTPPRDGGWRYEAVLRCRCLSADAAP